MALIEPRLNTPLLETSQAAKEQLINELIIKLVALATGEIKSKDLTSPPGNATAGDAFIVASGATGAWAGKSDRIAYLAITGAWFFLVPPRGQVVYVRDSNKNFRYDSGWSEALLYGDMFKANYDTDNDGIVDNSEELNGQPGTYYRSRANHTGTQPLSSLAQSGATVDQVVTWNGSAWVAADAGSAIAVGDEGVLLTDEAIAFNFTGGGVTATQSGGTVTITVPSPAIAVSDEGTLLTSAATSFNFTGEGITATNTGGAITVLVTSSTSDKTASLTTAVLSPNSNEVQEIALGRANAILKVTSNRACRVRFYLNTSYRTLDLSRPLGVDPVGEHGVLLEVVTSNINSVIDCAPLPVVASSNSSSNIVPVTVTNLDQTAGAVTVTINYLSF